MYVYVHICLCVHIKLLKVDIDITGDFYFLNTLYFQNVSGKYIFNIKYSLQIILIPFLIIFCILQMSVECIIKNTINQFTVFDITVYQEIATVAS